MLRVLVILLWGFGGFRFFGFGIHYSGKIKLKNNNNYKKKKKKNDEC